jgi:hypothetical protein
MTTAAMRSIDTINVTVSFTCADCHKTSTMRYDPDRDNDENDDVDYDGFVFAALEVLNDEHECR